MAPSLLFKTLKFSAFGLSKNLPQCDVCLHVVQTLKFQHFANQLRDHALTHTDTKLIFLCQNP